MSIDGLTNYELPDSGNLNTFFVTSGNWNIPTESDFILTNISF